MQSDLSVCFLTGLLFHSITLPVVHVGGGFVLRILLIVAGYLVTVALDIVKPSH